MIRHGRDTEIDDYLAGAVIDARLELTSWLGREHLATLTPRAGKITWDGSERRGALDVDVIADGLTLHARHPLANLGQVLEARWVWPSLGIDVPAGRWLISEPGERIPPLWQVSADPEGPARLARNRWWTPSGKVITGTLVAQLNQMAAEARIGWTPYGPLGDIGAPPTDCTTGGSVLESMQKVVDHCDADLRAARTGSGIVIARRHVNPDDAPDWTWVDGTGHVTEVAGTRDPQEVPNRVTVWYEEEQTGARTARGWSEPLVGGPRRWDGPYGRVPLVVKLDGAASRSAMRDQARRMLRQAQEAAATVRVEMRADPRIEPGDTARIRSDRDATDCLARVTSVSLDAATGIGTVEAAALTGTVAGVPATYIET